MARKQKKAGPKLLLQWVVALSVVLVIMTVLAMQIKPPDEPSPTSPTTTGILQTNPFGPDDFTYDENGFLTCLTARSIPGIDVSSHQGIIDWNAVKDAGVQFAFIRLGYRGYDSGTIHTDELAKQNLAGAKAAGLQIGAYFFSQAISAEEAQEEARFALDLLGGTALDLPLVFDWEFVSETARTGAMEPDTLTDCIHSFCAEVERKGYEPMVYFNPDLANTMLDLEELAAYPFWLAHYTDRMTFPHKVRFWQYSDEGAIPGIGEKVDLNLYFP
jgi:GH25 family lysozyme M1 (1,4-beta-N-acetylmuramidase)